MKTGAGIARTDWRRTTEAGCAAFCVLLFAGAVWFRLSVPLWPLLEPDTWNYLWPALSAIEAGTFTHAGGRAFPYPLFLWGVLAAFGDFRAITAVQYALGLGTALLALVGWRVAARMVDPSRRLWPGHSLGGVVVLFAMLFYVPGVGFERTIMPETLFSFAMALSAVLLLLALERCRERGDAGASLLLGVALASSLAALAVKPHWLFAVGATIAIVVLAGRAARIAWVRLALAIGIPVALFAVGFLLPERRLAQAHDRAGSSLFLPQTMFCWHLAAVLPALHARAADPAATAEFRALARDIDQVLKTEVFGSPGWYVTLGYDPDKCLYGTLGNVVGRHLDSDIDRMRDFYWQSFAQGLVSRPAAYAAKVLREMRSALASPLPYHAFTMPADHSVAVGRAVVGRSAMYDRAIDALAGGDEPKRRKLQSFSLLFYRPLALAANRLYVPMVGLALAAAVLASTRWGRAKLAPAPPDGRGAGWRFAPLLCLIALQSGINLTVATSHSHAVLRYRMVQYPLTFLVVATALLTVAALLAAYRDNARRR